MSKSTISTPNAPMQPTDSTSDRIEFGLTNDYMFKAVFQSNEKARRGILSAILHLDPDSIETCEVLNPMILGESVDSKTCILDIRVRLNNHTIINMEMQVGNLSNWSQRSMYYLCGLYVDLRKGQDYSETVPCFHIGFVNHSPFPGRSKFISRYAMTDKDDGHIYTSDFGLIMVDLSQIEQNDLEIDRSARDWAKLFLAKEWKEAEQIAQHSEAMQEAIATMKSYTNDEKIREQCLARILYEGDMSSARKEGMQEGMQIGLQKGEQRGIQKGQNRIYQLSQFLIRDDRLEDFTKSATDQALREQLFKEYGL